MQQKQRSLDIAGSDTTVAKLQLMKKTKGKPQLENLFIKLYERKCFEKIYARFGNFEDDIRNTEGL